jgi:hypothetical protein
MYKNLYTMLACTVAMTGSFIQTDTVQPALEQIQEEQRRVNEEMLERTNTRLTSWIEFVCSLDKIEQKHVLNYLFCIFAPQIVEFSPEQLSVMGIALSEHLEKTKSDNIKKTFDLFEDDMKYILTPFIRFLEKNILQQEPAPANEQEVAARTSLLEMHLGQMSVMIISMYYNALYSAIDQTIGKRYLLCIFGNNGLAEEKDQMMLPSFAEILSQLEQAQKAQNPAQA